MNQNDISKGQQYVQNDTSKKTNEIYGLFSSPLENTLVASLKKIEKIVAALYLITDVMDAKLPLTESLRKDSLELLSSVSELLTNKEVVSEGRIARVVIRLDHLESLVHIGSIAHHISPMNADVISFELKKLVTIFIDEATQLGVKERSFIVSPLAASQPTISGEIVQDAAFDAVMARYESKRHQNDIKTTLLNQNDIIKDTSKIKTTFQKDIVKPQDAIDRKNDILSAIKSKGVCTLNDIKLMVKNFSDKTLQREINRLVAMGLVRKEGNKRWTMYRVTNA